MKQRFEKYQKKYLKNILKSTWQTQIDLVNLKHIKQTTVWKVPKKIIKKYFKKHLTNSNRFGKLKAYQTNNGLKST